MTVTVRLFAGLPAKVQDRRPEGLPESLIAGTPVTLKLQEQTDLTSLLTRLRLETGEVLTMFVNGRARAAGHLLRDGDHVGLFPPIGGG